MKARIITLSLIAAVAIMMGCTKQPYYDIPLDSNGNVYITKISKVTTDNVVKGMVTFNVYGYFPNAKAGDVMKATVLKQQVPSGSTGTATQLLPVTGTEKSGTVGTDYKTTVTYTLAEAKLVNVGDAITIVFSGNTDSGIVSIVLK